MSCTSASAMLMLSFMYAMLGIARPSCKRSDDTSKYN
jgi:hypothetical protein